MCLDAIEEVIDEAIEKKCNMVLAHHPIVFSGLKSLTGKNYIERTIIKAIKNDIAIYAAHTNLDNVLEGVNQKIAQKLSLKNIQILEPKKGLLKKLYTYIPVSHTEIVRSALFEVGAGNIGKYSECSFKVSGEGTFKGNGDSNPFIGEKEKLQVEKEDKVEFIFPSYLERALLKKLFEVHPYEEVAYEIITLDNYHQEIGSGVIGELEAPMNTMEFLESLKIQMQTSLVRYTEPIQEKIQRIAVCGGAGSFLLNTAIAKKADVFITGDFKYHQFFDADGQIVIADIGHFESEQFTIELFYEILIKKFPNFALYLTKVITNPIKYI
jgi:dinuclear metal center YbgI/SA1388 family protein